MTLQFSVAMVIVVFLSVLALLFSHWPRWIKAVLTVGSLGFYFFAFNAVGSLLGQPSTDALPPRFVMVAAFVDEPRPKFAGAIYLWVTPIEEGRNNMEPRAFKLPYSRPMHEQVASGMKKGRDGVAQMGTAEARSGTGHAPSWLKPGNDEQEIKIADLPTPQLPEK